MVAMLFVPVATLAGISWWLLSREAIRPGHVIAALVLVAWVAVVGTKVYMDRVPVQAGVAAAASAFRMPEWALESAAASDSATRATPAETRALTAAPIAELIGGLEARLATEPNDVKGWALLAQSYAFVGDTSGAERALQRAIELGADEQALRDRVQAARREPEAGSWIERTVGG